MTRAQPRPFVNAAHGCNTSTPAVAHMCLQDTRASSLQTPPDPGCLGMIQNQPLPAQREKLTQAWPPVQCLAAVGGSPPRAGIGLPYILRGGEVVHAPLSGGLAKVWDDAPLLLAPTLIIELKLRKSKLKDKKRWTPTHTITTPGFRQHGEQSHLSEALRTLSRARQSIDISEVC